jgi:hypothetical protein
MPAPDATTGEIVAGWPVTDRLRVGPNWVSGYYQVRAVLTSGPEAGQSVTTYVIVRQPHSRSTILVQVPVNTWQAYNGWGGKSLYDFPGLQPRARVVSFDRPYLWSGPGGQGPLSWELPVVAFIERNRWDVSYQTDVFTDRHPRSLLRHRLVVVAGHDEYWSKRMRDGFDHARAAGVNLVFMGANDAYWQIRYDDDRRTIVEYKSLTADPEPNPALKTALFRELTPPRYECALMGVQHQGGFRHTAEPPIAYTVAPGATTHPWFRGSGLREGEMLPDLVGREWDAVPAYTDACPHPGLRVLFHADDVWGAADAVTFTAPSGGRVFSSGSHQFVWALDPLPSRLFDHPYGADPRLQRFVENVLDDLGGPYARDAR